MYDNLTGAYITNLTACLEGTSALTRLSSGQVTKVRSGQVK